MRKDARGVAVLRTKNFCRWKRIPTGFNAVAFGKLREEWITRTRTHLSILANLHAPRVRSRMWVMFRIATPTCRKGWLAPGIFSSNSSMHQLDQVMAGAFEADVEIRCVLEAPAVLSLPGDAPRRC